jgi:hypothetical protein
LLLNKNGDLNDWMFYSIGLTSNAASSTAAGMFPDQPGNNSPRNAFQHAYWSALMTIEFGDDFAEEFTTAHEKRSDEPTQEQFMDLHNNEIGRRIASENPGAPAYVLIDLVKQALQNGELYVWDGQNIYFSDDCPLCAP